MNKICRLCLEEGVLSSLFARNFNLSLSDMIEYCCNIKISKNDGLPEQVCSNCMYKLGVAYHFKQTSESADVRLRQYLALPLNNKTSDAAVMTDPMTIPTQTLIKRCKCQAQAKRSTNYKRKPEAEKKKRGPKPRPRPPRACFECGKEFRCAAQLEMHVRTHTGDRPFACTFCPRRFAQKHNLVVHARLHSGERPFQCDVCSRTFSAQGNLLTHLKIHSGQKDHTCTLCSKAFVTSSELTRHAAKHSGARARSCDICGASYVQARDLKLHKLKKHHIETSKTDKNETINIDIIGIDKETIPEPPAPPMKTHIEGPNMLLCGPKPVKVYDQYTGGEERQSCTICGEQFDFLPTLAQHYMQSHKGYDPINARSYNLP